MGWGKEWDDNFDATADKSMSKASGIPKSWGNKLTYKNYKEAYETDSIKNVDKLYNNMKPTHDPYANPNATIYYECNCGQILDPQTKSFAQLNNYSSEKGWKIRFGERGYTPYCVECGKDVE